MFLLCHMPRVFTEQHIREDTLSSQSAPDAGVTVRDQPLTEIIVIVIVISIQISSSVTLSVK
jgi:hypothetical protein